MLIDLIRGVQKFQREQFKNMQSLFKQLSTEQRPHTLFITCCDSRVDPTLITKSPPGNLFIVRNIGNIIPCYVTSSGSEAAAIEYALTMPSIKHIIICGHSNCGAMKGLLDPTLDKKLPAVASWLSHSQDVLNNIKKKFEQGKEEEDVALKLTIQNNILLQMEHLKTYPDIAKKLEQNKLTLHGWFYELEKG